MAVASAPAVADPPLDTASDWAAASACDLAPLATASALDSAVASPPVVAVQAHSQGCHSKGAISLDDESVSSCTDACTLSHSAGVRAL